MQLFVQRAQAVQSNFAVTPRNAAAVSAICARLEGLPLAIELAAAWVRALGVEQILERLDDAFGLLVGGSRSAPSRQQTMRATIDWSYGLLAASERVVFQRLAVFVGGWSLEAAETVCSGGRSRHTRCSRLTRLVDASLVQVEEREGRARYRLLEPVRQYAQMRSSASGELDAVRRQHAAFFESFARAVGDRREFRRARPPGRPRRAGARAGQPAGGAALVSGPGRCRDGVLLGRAHWTLWVVRGLSARAARGWHDWQPSLTRRELPPCGP